MKHLSLILLVLLPACGDASDTTTAVYGSDAGAESIADGGREQGTTTRMVGPLRISTVCGLTTCGKCELLRLEARTTCNECWDICRRSNDSSCVSTCTRACNNADALSCSWQCSSQVCADFDLTFEPVGTPNPAIQRACLDDASRLAECTGTPEDAAARCAVAGRVESESLLPTYACFTQHACEPGVADTCTPAPRHGLHNWFCNELALRLGSCAASNKLADAVAQMDPWLRDDVANAALLCEEERDSQGFINCVYRWVTAVGGTVR